MSESLISKNLLWFNNSIISHRGTKGCPKFKRSNATNATCTRQNGEMSVMPYTIYRSILKRDGCESTNAAA